MKRLLNTPLQLKVPEDHQAFGNNCYSARTCLTIIRDTGHTPQNWSQNLKSKKWKCHFCHCQLMYHKSLFKPPLLAAGKRKYCRTYWLIHKYHGNHNNLLYGFCGICNSGGRNITYMWIIVAKTAQIYEIHIMNYCICVKLLSFGK